MNAAYWLEFGILFAAALLGGVAILPYSLKLFNLNTQGKPLKMSVPKMLLLSFIQTAVLSAVVVGVGLLAAHGIGLGASYIEAALSGSVVVGVGEALFLAVVLGALAGFLLYVADLLFLPYWPQALLEAARRTSLWDNFLASFYGGINEELFMRLFGFSVLAWLLSQLFHPTTSGQSQIIFWTVNIVMAILFGLGHLPALKKTAGEISRVMFARSLILNAPVGLLCGWLFWNFGIEAAIIAHFSADIIYHVGGTAVLRIKNQL
jgi:hypothetical protein